MTPGNWKCTVRDYQCATVVLPKMSKPESRKFRFNQTNIARLPAAKPGKRDFYSDTESAGFQVQVTDKGAKTFFVKHRIGSKTPRYTIGRFPTWTVEMARQEAKKQLSVMLSGVDPNEAQREEQKAQEQKEKERESVEEVLSLYAKTFELRPSTLQSYSSSLSTVLGESFAAPVLEFTAADVQALHAAYHSKARANLAMRALRSLFNFQRTRCNLLDRVNPISAALSQKGKANRWHKPKRRKTVITDFAAWFDAVEALPDAGYRSNWNGETARDLFKFQVFTGLRSIDECASLEWSQVDLGANTLTYEKTKTTEAEPVVLPLNSHAAELLKDRAEEARYVFSHGDGFLADARNYVSRVRNATGTNWTPYDSRRTFLSTGEKLGIPPLTLKRLANHATVEHDITAGYVVPDLDAMRDASQRIADYILRMAKRTSADIVELKA